MKTYSEKLRDPRWQKKRLEILNRDFFCCQKCFDDKSTLNVHHKLYSSNTEPWDYPDSYLITLCETCHADEKKEMEDALYDLCRVLKEKFLACHIKEITKGFINYDHPHILDVSADTIKFFLSRPDVVHGVKDYYFESLRKPVPHGEGSDFTTVL
jgi:hypothetical protein